MVAGSRLQPTTIEEEALWAAVRALEQNVIFLRQFAKELWPELDREAIRAAARRFDFTSPLDPIEAVDYVAECLWRHQVHTPHPRYYGLFNPAPTTMGIAADLLVAAFNPQLAAWSHRHSAT